jgi:Methyltransferase domain
VADEFSGLGGKFWPSAILGHYHARLMSPAPGEIKLYRSFKTYGGLKPLYLDLRYRLNANRLGHWRELGIWLNAQGLTGTGAEIGVKEAKYSERILYHWKGRLLYSIDPWREFSPEIYRDGANVPAEEQEAFLAEAKLRLVRFGDRSKILRLTSEEAAREIPDGSLDFAYLDAQHHYEAVKEDIALWYPKIKPGGLLGGHDYLDLNEKDPVTGFVTVFGVKRAVNEFISKNPRLDFFTTTKGKLPSWFVRKP